MCGVVFVFVFVGLVGFVFLVFFFLVGELSVDNVCVCVCHRLGVPLLFPRFYCYLKHQLHHCFFLNRGTKIL